MVGINGRSGNRYIEDDLYKVTLHIDMRNPDGELYKAYKGNTHSEDFNFFPYLNATFFGLDRSQLKILPDTESIRFEFIE